MSGTDDGDVDTAGEGRVRSGALRSVTGDANGTEGVVTFIWHHGTLDKEGHDSLWDAIIACQAAWEYGSGAPARIEIDGRTVLAGDQVDHITKADLPRVQSGEIHAQYLREVAAKEAAERQAEDAFRRQLEDGGQMGWVECPIAGREHRILLTTADMDSAFIRGSDDTLTIDPSGVPSVAEHMASAHPDLSWHAPSEQQLRAEGYVPVPEWKAGQR